MSEVKRYDYGYKDNDCGGARYLGLIEKPDGALVRHSDYARLEQECERLSNELNNMRISWGLMQSEREAALEAECERLRADLRFLAEYIAAESAGHPLPNYLAIGRFPVDVARAALNPKP